MITKTCRSHLAKLNLDSIIPKSIGKKTITKSETRSKVISSFDMTWKEAVRVGAVAWSTWRVASNEQQGRMGGGYGVAGGKKKMGRAKRRRRRR